MSTVLSEPLSPVVPPTAPAPPRHPTLALVGNPNCGKTTLFNALTGLRTRTANFPGTTIERRLGRCRPPHRDMVLIDLPGLYGLNATSPEERVVRDVLVGERAGHAMISGIVLLVDATNLERNLFLASQVLELGVPVVITLNMTDLAHRMGIRIDVEQMQRRLGCPVVPICARTGQGLGALREAMSRLADGGVAVPPRPTVAACADGCEFRGRYTWAEAVASECVVRPPMSTGSRSERIDRLLTHPLLGLAIFVGVMFAMFFLIFQLAEVPMALIEMLFAHLGAWVASVVPAGDLQSLLVNGVIAGVGGVLVFLPQICILFFVLTLLEDTGYLARAAFVMDRLMQKVGLPGKAFVPMLSAHACAIPAIMASRVIDDQRDRLVTILVTPLLTCSARLPVYTMVVALLFANEPLKGALLFTGAYALGTGAAFAMAWVFKKTILRGESRPLVMELPSYKQPCLRNATYTMIERARKFVVTAGTIILAISVLLWAAATYPRSAAPEEAIALMQQAEQLQQQGLDGPAEDLLAQADRLSRRHQLEYSLAGTLGRGIEPAIRPLGFDWQIGVGILSSFAAREVIVSTLAITYGLGEEAAEDDPQPLYDTMRSATHADGRPVFTLAASISLLVFYVLAMQCLPTNIITARETGSWKWPVLQFGYMTLLAYGGSLIAYQCLAAMGYA